MIEGIVKVALVIVGAYVGYHAFWKYIMYKPNWDELHQSMSECPKCENLLYVEYGRYANMYRCKNCRFEGLREPVVYAIAQATQKRLKKLKRKLNNVR